MKAGRPSFTAAWVATCRGLGAGLPAEARLADDPFGLRFAGLLGDALGGRAGSLVARRPPMARWVVYMQVRTRLIDDALRDFVRDGGLQVLLLGAGFDCRATRFAAELAGATVFEVDHPATQARKRAILGVGNNGASASAHIEYVEWDFEHRALAELPAALVARGHDPGRPTLTIWEGVSMYLTDEAIEASVAAVRTLSAPGSPFVFTYFDRSVVSRPSLDVRLRAAVVSRAGEPWKHGWVPSALPAWLNARGFHLDHDDAADAAARRLLPPEWARLVVRGESHVALARRTG